MIRAIGERVSRLALAGFRRVSCCRRGECRRGWGVFCLVGLLVGSDGGSSTATSGGGAAGNLKLCEKDLEAFRVVGSAGVLGVVVMPGRLRAGGTGKAKSWVGGEAPPDSGEGWVAERWPGEATVAVSVKEACQGGLAAVRTGIRVGAAGHDLQTGRAGVAPRRASGSRAAVEAGVGGRVGVERDDRQRAAVALGGRTIARRVQRQRQRGPVGGAHRLRRRRQLRGKRRVARHRRPRRRVHRGQPALALAAIHEAVLPGCRRARAALCSRDIRKGDGALNVLASEHGRVGPAHEYPDVRPGHGRDGGGAGGGSRGNRGCSSGALVVRHGGTSRRPGDWRWLQWRWRQSMWDQRPRCERAPSSALLVRPCPDGVSAGGGQGRGSLGSWNALQNTSLLSSALITAQCNHTLLVIIT